MSDDAHLFYIICLYKFPGHNKITAGWILDLGIYTCVLAFNKMCTKFNLNIFNRYWVMVKVKYVAQTSIKEKKVNNSIIILARFMLLANHVHIISGNKCTKFHLHILNGFWATVQVNVFAQCGRWHRRQCKRFHYISTF